MTKRTWFVSAGVLLILFIATVPFNPIFRAVFSYVSGQDMLVPSEITVPLSAVAISQTDYPARLRIPTLRIDTKIQKVGLTKSHAMATPTNFSDAGWYKYGPVPGMVGSAVLDGHVDNALGFSGVFKHLDSLAIGDYIYIDTDSGVPLRFQVIDTKLYSYTEVPTTFIFTTADAARLNLITCGGNWISKEKTYDKRLVVFTKLVRGS